MRTTAVYARISSDPKDKRLGVERQLRSARETAERLGWDPVAEYVDNSKSAADMKARPEFARLRADVRAGRVARLIAWEQDRLTRDLGEWADLRRDLKRHHVEVAYVNGGIVDVASPQGGISTGVRAVLAESEVEVKAERQTAWCADRAARGLPQGRPAYGYVRGVETDRLGYRVRSWDEVDPATAAVVAEVARRLLSGETVRGVAGSLNDRGVPAPGGGRWLPKAVRTVVTNPTVAGRRRLNGTVVGPAASEPILDGDTFDRVVALLADPERRRHAASSNKAAHLLSGLARCGVCGTAVRVTAGGYRCPNGHTTRRVEPVDEFVLGVVAARLSQPDAAEVLMPAPPDVAGPEAELDALRGRLDLAADEFAEGRIDAATWRRINEKLRPQAQELERRIADARRRAGQPDVLADLIGEPDVRDYLDTLSLARRRAVVDTLLTVTLLPVGKSAGQRMRWHGFDPATVRIEWKGEAA